MKRPNLTHSQLNETADANEPTFAADVYSADIPMEAKVEILERALETANGDLLRDVENYLARLRQELGNEFQRI